METTNQLGKRSQPDSGLNITGQLYKILKGGTHGANVEGPRTTTQFANDLMAHRTAFV